MPAVSDRKYIIVPPTSSGVVPSLLTAGISDDEPQTRATSSITMADAIASPPSPPNASGM